MRINFLPSTTNGIRGNIFRNQASSFFLNIRSCLAELLRSQYILFGVHIVGEKESGFVREIMSVLTNIILHCFDL